MKNNVFIFSKVTLLVLALFSLEGCSKKKAAAAGASFTGSAKFLNGATSVASLSGSKKINRAPHFHSLSDGNWYLTPDQMTLTVTSISFQGTDGSQSNSDVNCTITTDQTKPSLAELTDCAFTVSAGTYSRVSIMVSTVIDFKIDDSTNDIYSKSSAPHLLDTTGPAETVSVDLKSCSDPCTSTETFSSTLSTPVVIDSETDAKIYVIVDPTHFLSVMSSGGVFSQAPGKAGTDLPLIPLTAPAGKVEFYTNVGTPLNVNIDTVTTTPTASEEPMGIRMYYDSDQNPVKVNIRYGDLGGGPCASDSYKSAWNGAPASGGETNNFGVAGYLGLDSGGTIAWIEALDPDWSTFGVIYSVPQGPNLGDATTLSFQCTSTMPAPVSGNNYSSGAPTITPTGTRHLKLVAD